MSFLVAVILLGILVGYIAKQKGRSPLLWGIYGALLFIVALPHILFTESKNQCPHCAETVKGEASVCKHCGRDL